MIVNDVKNYLEHGTIANSVNFPALSAPHNNSIARLAVINQNIPNMVGQISSKIGEAKLNIISLFNQSRGEIAYTLIDLNAPITDRLLQDILTISGVIQARKVY